MISETELRERFSAIARKRRAFYLSPDVCNDAIALVREVEASHAEEIARIAVQWNEFAERSSNEIA